MCYKVWKYVLQLMNKEHSFFVCLLFIAFYHIEMQTLELPSENKMYMGDF